MTYSKVTFTGRKALFDFLKIWNVDKVSDNADEIATFMLSLNIKGTISNGITNNQN